MKFALIQNNIVINIIIADEEFIAKHHPEAICVDDIQCGIGWTYDGQKFSQPTIQETDAETL